MARGRPSAPARRARRHQAAQGVVGAQGVVVTPAVGTQRVVGPAAGRPQGVVGPDRRATPRPPLATRPRDRDRDRGLGGEQVEGRQAVRELLLAGRRKVRELWIATDLEDAGVIADIVDLATPSGSRSTRSAARSSTQARSEAPQGVLAKAAPLRESDLDDLASATRRPAAPFLVAVDGVTDPGNLGALLRSADGAGVTVVLPAKHRAVHVTPDGGQSGGGRRRAPADRVVSGPAGRPFARQATRGAGSSASTTPPTAPSSTSTTSAAEPVVLVLGAEGAGLSRLVRERCDVVTIPCSDSSGRSTCRRRPPWRATKWPAAGDETEPGAGIEPAAYRLQGDCSAS